MTNRYRVLAGVSPDGARHYITSNTPVCENCEGNGRYWMEAGFEAWQKAGWVECECCHGSGEGKEDDE